MNINIIILGNQGVGKTTIIDSFIEKKFFPAEHPTLGIDTRVVNVKADNNQLIQYNYFDSEGSEKDNSTNLSFISKADGIILVYDGELSEEKKKTDLLKWKNIIGKYCTPDIYEYVWLVCNIKSKNTINIEKEKEIIKTLNYSTNLLSVIDYEDHTHKINPFFETVNNTILEKDAIKQRMGYKYQNERGWRCIII